jgi:hypothetical protein
VAAQRGVFDIIEKRVLIVDTAASDAILPPVEYFDVVRSLANRVLNFASVHGLAAVESADLSGLRGDVDLSAASVRGRSALNNNPPVRAVDTAVGIAAALHILRGGSVVENGKRARWLVTGQNADTGPAEIRSCSRDDVQATAIILRARGPSLGPELQLRYRIPFRNPRVPHLDRPRVESIARALPSVMWPAWSAWLLPDLRGTLVVRSTLSFATLLASSRIRPVLAARLLGITITHNAANSRLWVLCGSEYWPEICASLILLSDFLDEDGSAIDYARRRALDYSNLLPSNTWKNIVKRSDYRPQNEFDLVRARHYLVDRLSGGTSPRLPNGTVDTAVERGAAKFESGVTSGLRKCLDRYAASFLRRRGIKYEPVVWHAPLYLIEGLDLPDPDTKAGG